MEVRHNPRSALEVQRWIPFGNPLFCFGDGWDAVIYQFEAFSLDTESLELRDGEDPVAIEPGVFSVLAYLIEHRDRVVSKDELIEAIWGGRAISDGALNSRINAARRAVGDSGSAQSVIKTFPRRGFRFVSSITEDQTPDAKLSCTA